MNRKLMFIGVFAFMMASLLPSAQALYQIVPSELSVSIGTGEMPVLYYNEPGLGDDQSPTQPSPSQPNEADFTFTIDPGESISFDLKIMPSVDFLTNRPNGNSTFVTFLEGEAVPLYGSSLDGLDINCDIQYPAYSLFYQHETLHVQNPVDGKLSGGYNYPIRVEGGETAKVSISLDAGRAEPVSFCLTLGAYPTETYEYAYVVGTMTEPNGWQPYPAYRMTPSIDESKIVNGQKHLVWEWKPKDEKNGGLTNAAIKAQIEINEANGPTMYWSAGDNWNIDSSMRVTRVTWINVLGADNPYIEGINCDWVYI